MNKLLLMQAACIEKAAETLGPWPPTGDNYQLAWDVLMRAYNDEYHVMHGILGKLFAIPRQERENHGSLRVVYQTVTNSLRQLRTIRPEPEEILDQVMIHLAKSRLPKRTLDSWEQQRNRRETDDLPSCDEFLKFLETKSKGRREFESEDTAAKEGAGGKQKSETRSSRYKPYDGNHSRDKSYQRSKNETSGAPRNTSCAVPGCKENHPMWRCEAFVKLPYNERNNLVQTNRLCRCCLSTGHFSFTCTRPPCAKCPEAKYKHHSKLCPKSADQEKTKASVLCATAKRQEDAPRQ